MASFGKVVKTAGKVVITPVRIADNFALNVAADGIHYFLTKAVPPSWVWNRVPASVKTALKNQLLDHNSHTRVTLDSFVTAAAGLAVADKVAGPDVALYREIIDFYANNRLFAAGLTVGIPSAAIAIYDIVKHVKHGHGIPTWGKNAYGAALVTAAALLFGSTLFAHPVGMKGVTEDGGKPAAVEQKPLTQQDLEAYVANTLLPQFQQSLDKMSEEQRTAFQDYVKQFVEGYVAEQLAKGGYVTDSNLEKLGRQISGQISSLESRIRAAQATPTPPPTATPQPPTPTPTAIFGSGILEGYLNLAGKHYVVPVSLLKAVAATDVQGLASLLTNGDANLLVQLTNGDNADNELVQLKVSIAGVTAMVQYGTGAGPKPIPLQQTNPLQLSRYLQGNLTPVQLSTIQPVTN